MGCNLQAFEADSTNVAVLTNRAAVRFEQKNYDECVNDCKLAIETGRSVRADFKVNILFWPVFDVTDLSFESRNVLSFADHCTSLRENGKCVCESWAIR